MVLDHGARRIRRIRVHLGWEPTSSYRRTEGQSAKLERSSQMPEVDPTPPGPCRQVPVPSVSHQLRLAELEFENVRFSTGCRHNRLGPEMPEQFTPLLGGPEKAGRRFDPIREWVNVSQLSSGAASQASAGGLLGRTENLTKT